MKNRHFKVVKVRKEYWKDGTTRLVSSSPCHGGELEYSTKTFTKMIPNTMGLFTFDNYFDAERFARQMSEFRKYINQYEYRVYAVETRGAAVPIKILLGLSTTFLAMLAGRTRKVREQRLQDNYNSTNTAYRKMGSAPHGCVSFVKVKLVRLCASFQHGLEKV